MVGICLVGRFDWLVALDKGLELAEQSVSFLNGHDGPVNAAQFSEDSQYLYSAGYDGHI